MKHSIRTFVLSILLLTGFAVAQRISDTGVHQAIREATDRRDVSRLFSYFGKEPLLDRQILLCLASVQSDSALNLILTSLESARPEIRSAAAFALGQTLRVSTRAIEYESAIVARLSKELEMSVRAGLLDAIGRFGSQNALEKIAELTFKDTLLLEAQARAIGRFAIRGIRSKAAADKAGEIYRTSVYASYSPSGNNYAVYALMRISDSSMIASQEYVLLEAINSRNPYARMHAASALGKLRTPEAFDAITSALSDRDWRVHVNAIRSLSSFATIPQFQKQIIRVFDAELKNQNYQILKTVLQTLPLIPFTHPRFMNPLAAAIDTNSSDDIRNEAIRTLALTFPDLAQVRLQGWMRLEKPSSSMLQAAGLLAEKGVMHDQSSLNWISGHTTSQISALATAALEAWSKCWKAMRKIETAKTKSETDSLFRNVLLRGLRTHSNRESQNTAAVQTIVEILSDSLFIAPHTSSAFIDALSSFSSKDDVETVITLLEAIGRTGDSSNVETIRKFVFDDNPTVRIAAFNACKQLGATLESTLPPAASEKKYDWSLLKSLPPNPIAVIVTSRGIIRAQLFKDEAPFTVESFVRLSRQGFYDGLTFHRVVPNFVVQGGDPRGDGTGGPPYTIRSEFSERSFVCGAIGMASSGKDTEGSQFFIMHSHHPHLDGKYTLFGEVTDGMDVVDQLQIGDRILSISIPE